MQAGKPQAKENREEDDRQHFAPGNGGENIGRDQVEDRLDERVFMLDLVGGLLVLGNVHGTQGAHIDAGTWMEHVSQHQADHDRDGGHHLEIDNGFQADAAQLLRVTDTGDTDNQRGNHDRDDNHLDQPDENITGRLQDITDPPCLFSTEVVKQRANRNAQNQTYEDLPGEAEFCLLHVITLLFEVDTTPMPNM
ncbi:hypothetical protein D9M71_131330 [compost metagenome]